MMSTISQFQPGNPPASPHEQPNRRADLHRSIGVYGISSALPHRYGSAVGEALDNLRGAGETGGAGNPSRAMPILLACYDRRQHCGVDSFPAEFPKTETPVPVDFTSEKQLGFSCRNLRVFNPPAENPLAWSSQKPGQVPRLRLLSHL